MLTTSAADHDVNRSYQAAVQRYLDGRNIEIIAGDIACTCRRLQEEDLVLTFIDPRWLCLHDTGVFYRQEPGR